MPEKPGSAASILRRAQQHGDMAIVAAAMETAGHAAGPGQVGLLVDRQRIHVGAQAQRAAAAARAQHPDHAGAADAFVHLDPGRAQGFGDAGGGAVFGKAEFGMGVDFAAQRDQRCDQIGNFSS